jgi:hypothetical protein
MLTLLSTFLILASLVDSINAKSTKPWIEIYDGPTNRGSDSFTSTNDLENDDTIYGFVFHFEDPNSLWDKNQFGDSLALAFRMADTDMTFIELMDACTHDHELNQDLCEIEQGGSEARYELKIGGSDWNSDEEVYRISYIDDDSDRSKRSLRLGSDSYIRNAFDDVKIYVLVKDCDIPDEPSNRFAYNAFPSKNSVCPSVHTDIIDDEWCRDYEGGGEEDDDKRYFDAFSFGASRHVLDAFVECKECPDARGSEYTDLHDSGEYWTQCSTNSTATDWDEVEYTSRSCPDSSSGRSNYQDCDNGETRTSCEPNDKNKPVCEKCRAEDGDGDDDLPPSIRYHDMDDDDQEAIDDEDIMIRSQVHDKLEEMEEYEKQKFDFPQGFSSNGNVDGICDYSLCIRSDMNCGIGRYTTMNEESGMCECASCTNAVQGEVYTTVGYYHEDSCEVEILGHDVFETRNDDWFKKLNDRFDKMDDRFDTIEAMLRRLRDLVSSISREEDEDFTKNSIVTSIRNILQGRSLGSEKW